MLFGNQNDLPQYVIICSFLHIFKSFLLRMSNKSSQYDGQFNNISTNMVWTVVTVAIGLVNIAERITPWILLLLLSTHVQLNKKYYFYFK